MKENYDLIINKGKNYNLAYALIETPCKLPVRIEIAEIIRIYSIDQISQDLNNEFINHILDYKEHPNRNINYFILAIKIFSPTIKDIPKIGIGIIPHFIFLDVLNILTLYYGDYFRIVAGPKLFFNVQPYFLINNKFRKCQNKDDLSENVRKICMLRIEQFYLIQKCLNKYQESILASNYEVDLALALLISSIEPASQKYSTFNDKFEDTNFGIEIKKLVKNGNGLCMSDDLYKEISQIFMKTQYNKIYAKSKSFCVQFFPQEYYNEKIEQLFKDLYYLRNKYLHGGQKFTIEDRNSIIKFNPFEKGKLKHFKDEKGKHSKIVRLPPYNFFLMIFNWILLNFINYLSRIRDDTEDKQRYSKSDMQKRGQLTISINKGGVKPGMAIFESDYYKEMDYLLLRGIQLDATNIRKLMKEEKMDKAISKIEKLINHPLFNPKYYFCRYVLYAKIEILFIQKKYQDVLNEIEINQFEINKETLDIFNLKGYATAHLGNFNKANKILEEGINVSKTLHYNSISNKDAYKFKYHYANFLDSKGEILQMQGNISEAISYYEKSLNLKNDPPFWFHKKTKSRLNKCKKSLFE